MVKMSLGASNSQSSSSSSVSSERISAYNSAISSLSSFMGTNDLQGHAYSSAKNYASSILIPLIQGAILLSEAVSNSVSEFPSRYTSEVAGESLDSEVLEAQIATYQAAYNRTSALLESLMSKEILNPRTISQVQSAMSRNMSKIRELQEKLDKLLAFDASSPSIFDDISTLESAVAQGLSQVNNGFSTFNGTFSIPSRQELAWVDTISSAWEKRENEINSKLTFEDVSEIQVINTLAAFYEKFKNIMESDPAKYVSEVQKLLPTKLVKTLKTSEGFEEIIKGLAKTGVRGEKAAFFVLEHLVKYDEFSKYLQTTKMGTVMTVGSDVFDALKKIADPVKTFFKETLQRTETYKAIADTAKANGTITIIGKGLKFAGRATTALTFADIAVSGVVGGAKEFTKTQDVGKAAIAATFSSIKRVGPLEGATIGAVIGSGIPIIGTTLGAVIGLVSGGIISMFDKFGYIDMAQKFLTQKYEEGVESINKVRNTTGNSVSPILYNLAGIGKVVGFG